MRWGFDGMLQVQFRGVQYSVSLGNLTLNVDGIKVRIHVSLQAFFPHNKIVIANSKYNQITHMDLFLLALPGRGDDAYEPVPTVFLLFSAYRCSVGLYVALLSVTQVH